MQVFAHQIFLLFLLCQGMDGFPVGPHHSHTFFFLSRQRVHNFLVTPFQIRRRAQHFFPLQRLPKPWVHKDTFPHPPKPQFRRHERRIIEATTAIVRPNIKLRNHTGKSGQQQARTFQDQFIDSLRVNFERIKQKRSGSRSTCVGSTTFAGHRSQIRRQHAQKRRQWRNPDLNPRRRLFVLPQLRSKREQTPAVRSSRKPDQEGRKFIAIV